MELQGYVQWDIVGMLRTHVDSRDYGSPIRTQDYEEADVPILAEVVDWRYCKSDRLESDFQFRVRTSDWLLILRHIPLLPPAWSW